MKKNFMCTHTWASDEVRIAFSEQSAGLTDRQLFEGMRTDSTELLANWMGKEDFFYCHWLAESEDAIFKALDQLGLNDVMVSMPHEMSRFVTHDNIKDKFLDNPYE